MGESSRYEITVEPRATYIEDQSDPSKNQYVFAYTISVTNTGTVPAQLISRHWVITDANNKVMEVKGLGVVGQQPLLKPGESFEYTSGCPLPTASGAMNGRYLMRSLTGEAFDVDIPIFLLESPHERRQIH